MSFILDALKKAESERSRSSGPVLMDVRVAAPRRHLPVWAWVIGVVLLANLGVLAWLLLRTPVPAEVAAGAAAAPVATAPPAAAAPVAPATLPAPAAMDPGQAAAAPALPATPGFELLPTMQDLAAAGVALPSLQLNLHVYDASPLHRYVLLNGARLREGEYTSDGVKLESITPEGVVLEASGRRFRLAAGG